MICLGKGIVMVLLIRSQYGYPLLELLSRVRVYVHVLKRYLGGMLPSVFGMTSIAIRAVCIRSPGHGLLMLMF